MITQVKVPEQHFSNVQPNMIVINWMKNNTINFFHPESSNLHKTALAIFKYIFFLLKCWQEKLFKNGGIRNFADY